MCIQPIDFPQAQSPSFLNTSTSSRLGAGCLHQKAEAVSMHHYLGQMRGLLTTDFNPVSDARIREDVQEPAMLSFRITDISA